MLIPIENYNSIIIIHIIYVMVIDINYVLLFF